MGFGCGGGWKTWLRTIHVQHVDGPEYKRLLQPGKTIAPLHAQMYSSSSRLWLSRACFSLLQTDPCPGLDSANVQGFLCMRVSDDPKIGCCGTCRPSRKHKLKPWAIALIVVAGVLCCLGVCVVIIYRKLPRSNYPPKVGSYVPGGRHETPPVSPRNQSSPGELWPQRNFSIFSLIQRSESFK